MSVNELEWNQKEENESLLGKMRQQSENMQTSIKENVRELKDLTAQIQTEVTIATAKVTDTARVQFNKRINEAADKAIVKIDELTAETTKKVKAVCKEVDGIKVDIHYERGFRKFFFWASPIMLLIQTVAIIILAI